MTLYYLMENIALTYSQASNVGVIVSIAPVFTAITARIFLKEEGKLQPAFFIGCVIALIGISIISFSGTTMHLNPIGDILSVGAAMVCSSFKENGSLWLFSYPDNEKNLFLRNLIYDSCIIFL